MCQLIKLQENTPAVLTSELYCRLSCKVESVQLPFCCKGGINCTSSARSGDRFPLSPRLFRGEEQWPIAGVLPPAQTA